MNRALERYIKIDIMLALISAQPVCLYGDINMQIRHNGNNYYGISWNTFPGFNYALNKFLTIGGVGVYKKCRADAFEIMYQDYNMSEHQYYNVEVVPDCIGVVFEFKKSGGMGDLRWVVENYADAKFLNDRLILAGKNVRNQVVRFESWNTCSENWSAFWSQITPEFSDGIYFGVRGVGSGMACNRSYAARFGTSAEDAGKVSIAFWEGREFSTLATSATLIDYKPGDRIEMRFGREGIQLWAYGVNSRTAQHAEVECHLSLDESPYYTPIMSQYAVWPIGGDCYIDEISIFNTVETNVDWLIVGDSIAAGSSATSVNKRFSNVVATEVANVWNYSAGWNATSDVLHCMPELLKYKSKNIILMIGGNDILYRIPNGVWQSNYKNIVVSFENAGSRVFHCLPTPRTTVDERPLKQWIQTNYSANIIIDTWTPLVDGDSSLKGVFDPGDGVHPNNAGHQMLGETIIHAIKP